MFGKKKEKIQISSNILTGILLKFLGEVFERLRKIDYNTIEGRKFGLSFVDIAMGDCNFPGNRV